MYNDNEEAMSDMDLVLVIALASICLGLMYIGLQFIS